jgi:hypothetical protein
MRTIVNAAADGSSIKLADPGAETTEWQLEYSGLSDSEASALADFFATAEGTLNGFTFLDPTGNLLAWSGKLDDAVWEKAPLVLAAGGVADPVGGADAWRLSNSGAGPQQIRQTISAPGGYLYCLSVYARSAQPVTVALLRGAERLAATAGPDWRRLAFTGNGDASAESVAFGLELPALSAVEVYGFQAEAQPAPSAYKASSDGGVYESARFGNDAISVTAAGVNLNTASVKIIHAKHL